MSAIISAGFVWDEPAGVSHASDAGKYKAVQPEGLMAKTPIILCVDDYMPNLVSLEAVLEDTRWQLALVQSGQAVLNMLAAGDVSMLIMGLRFQDMDGLDLLDAISKKPTLSKLPIIVLSAARRDEEVERRFYEKGALDYLRRPLDPFILRAKVEFLLKDSAGA